MVANLSPPLFIVYFGLSFYGLAVKPSPFRPLLILPIAGIFLYLVQFGNTGHPIYDYLLGTLLCGNLFSSFDFIVLTDVQNELRLVGQAEPISKASPDERLKWAFKLFTSVRGIGWTHEPTHALYIPRMNVPRAPYVALQVVRLVGYIFFLRIHEAFRGYMGSAYIPKPFSGTFFSLLDALRLPYLACSMAHIHMTLSYTSLSIVSMGAQKTVPQDWPPIFGAFSDTYTVRKCWGRTWHQLLRRMVSSHGKYLAHRILRLKKGSFASSYVQLYTGFFISGVIHHTGDYMISRLWEGRSLHFFLLQAVAITFEDAVITLGKTLGIRGSGAWKLAGHAWCWLWFAYSMPIWLTPIFQAAGLKE